MRDNRAPMIRTYAAIESHCTVTEGDGALEAAAGAAWIDVHSPTPEEEAAVERIVGADIPTREEMAEIEASSRAYLDGDAAVMTLPLLIRSTADYPETTHVTFVLTPGHLATVRYAEPTAFGNFATSLKRDPRICAGPQRAFTGLLDAIVDRLADVLEHVARELDSIGREVFGSDAPPRGSALRHQIQRLGRNNDIVSKARETLVGLSRVTAFALELDMLANARGIGGRLKTISRDADVLTEHAGYLSGKIEFLLDANLGMINIEQNAIIKIFSVVAVVFLPPTLIASVYGMNFARMPELSWPFGYPLAIGLMIVSMLIPLAYFRSKRWI